MEAIQESRGAQSMYHLMSLPGRDSEGPSLVLSSTDFSRLDREVETFTESLPHGTLVLNTESKDLALKTGRGNFKCLAEPHFRPTPQRGLGPTLQRDLGCSLPLMPVAARALRIACLFGFPSEVCFMSHF